jgi:hypothetical protein
MNKTDRREWTQYCQALKDNNTEVMQRFISRWGATSHNIMDYENDSRRKANKKRGR